MNIIFTVCNRTSLSNALALANSAVQYTGSVFYLCWVDTIEITNLPSNIRLLPVSSVQLPQWKEMTALYYDFELLPACRPWFAKHLLNIHPDVNTLTFLSPTVFLYHSLSDIIATDGGMLVTPHITGALERSPILDDKRILNVGMFHAGSWTLNRSAQTLQFLDWWAERTIDRAQFDLCNGMCMDQLWLNFVLVRVHNARQLTHPGWHYGLHSVLNKVIELRGDKYFVSGKPLISADFAGLEFFDPVWSDHAPLLAQSGQFKQLYADYKKVVNSFRKDVPLGKPGFGRIPDIKPNRLLRKKLANNIKSVTRFIDQF
ncbi:hypothetical protein [Dyadobacter sp. CY312]|uniref:hypothetical protein n=1 Tax=Dyadobacter sp. CY312 TaxID=2907303 RepID=UPI001F334B5E|nr:hypothetical protein [Dyadobacter sp. CY312]MCE7040073.1 hypothetical protein [Dyadobacter sp. CY312]